MASADFLLRLAPSSFQTQGKISPGKNTILPRTTAGFTPPTLDHESFAAFCQLALVGPRLISDSCPSAHGFAIRFLPTLGHPCAVAFHFARCGQLAAGLSPPRSRPCWAHKRAARLSRPSGRAPLLAMVFRRRCPTDNRCESHKYH